MGSYGRDGGDVCGFGGATWKKMLGSWGGKFELSVWEFCEKTIGGGNSFLLLLILVAFPLGRYCYGFESSRTYMRKSKSDDSFYA